MVYREYCILRSIKLWYMFTCLSKISGGTTPNGEPERVLIHSASDSSQASRSILVLTLTPNDEGYKIGENMYPVEFEAHRMFAARLQ